jgi:two-component system phosphate regulon response regulator PhoB
MLGLVSRVAERILIIEDDLSLSSSLYYSLEAVGYQIRIAQSGNEAMQLLLEHHPDLVLLDIELPDISGFEVCRRIRTTYRLEQPAIIFVTARTQETDRVAGFEVGADDFVSKPYSISELMLRIQARLHARSPSEAVAVKANPPPDESIRRVRLGPLDIDRASHRVFLNEKEINLSVQEMRLLNYLVSESGTMHTRRELLTAVWGYHPEATSRTLDTHIKRLRDKFGEFASMIQTVHGVGYRITSPLHRDNLTIPCGHTHRRR